MKTIKPTTKDLLRLAEQVRQSELKAGEANARTLECYRQSGEILAELRQRVTTGWEAWVQEHTGLSPQWASGRIRIASGWKKVQKALKKDPHLSYRQALALLANPTLKRKHPSSESPAPVPDQGGTEKAEPPKVRVPAAKFYAALTLKGLIGSAQQISEILAEFGIEVVL